MKNEIIDYLKTSKIIIKDRLMKKPFFDTLITMQQDDGYDDLIEYCYYLKTREKGKCQYEGCANSTKFLSFKKGYNNGCCEDHTKRLNNLKKYGVENVMQSNEIKEKQQSSMLEKYGSLHALQNDEILEKMKETQLVNGGIGAANSKIKEKMKKTNLEKYGVENVMQISTIKEKHQTTMLEKYGSKHALQNDEINKKRIQTNIEKFGAKHHMYSESFKKKMKIDFIKTKLEKISFRVSALFDTNTYSDIEQELKWKCNDCKSEFVDNLNNGKIPRCLVCFPLINKGYSKVEQELVNEIKKSFSIIENDRNVLNGKELDIYIPDKNIAIEFNGIYWHSELQGKDKNYHLNKTQQCEAKGIQLIHVFETEWIDQQEIVYSIINAKLGKFKTRIYARKCEIKEIDSKTKNQFLEENHLQGQDKSSVKLGLFYDGVLVSVMTFGKSRYNKNYQYEMHRFCNKLGYQIIGGASKLWSYFLKTYIPNSVITYADRRYSDGLFYEKIGFRKNGVSKPNFFIINKGKLESRLNWQKHLLSDKLDNFNSELTAWENIQLSGLNRIWDCGNYVFEWKKN